MITDAVKYLIIYAPINTCEITLWQLLTSKAFPKKSIMTKHNGSKRFYLSKHPFLPVFFFFQSLLQYNMSTKFLYEDEHGNVDENGGPEHKRGE